MAHSLRRAGDGTDSLKQGVPALPGLTSLWTETTGDPGVCVAVLDGPVDLSHPCFDGARLVRLETLVPGNADGGPASRHGTHVASIIFGRHGGPIRGIAPGCRGLVIPMFTDGRNEELAPCSQLDLARGITQAVQQGAHVINISGGQFDPSGEAHPFLADAVRLCASNGVLIVAATGNEGCECLHVPAALSSVLAVGAMDANGLPLEFSNWGEAYRTQGILAPGENVWGAVPGGGTASHTGTSFATPIVSGMVALLLSLQLKRGDKPDPYTARDAILNSAIGCEEQPIPNCSRLLAGRLNVPGAMNLTQGGKMDMSDQDRNQDLREIQDPATGSVDSGTSAEQVSTPGIQAREVAYPAPEATPSPPVVPTAEAPDARESAMSVTSGRVMPSANGGVPASLVYALGRIGHDFGSEARHDSFVQLGVVNPRDTEQLLAHHAQNPAHAAGHIWTLTQETTSIYAIQPGGAFAHEVYARLCEFLNGQLKEGVEQVSIPGVLSGTARLLNGQVVPAIVPDIRGMYSWSTPALVGAVLGKPPAGSRKQEAERYQRQAGEIGDFLNRVYYELRNLGVAPQERAMNYAATNAFQAGAVYKEAIEAEMKLDTIEVERSPICRPGSDCWDVKLTFFNPSKRQEQARKVYRFTVDVSDVVPVTVGEVRHWHVY